MNPFKKFSILHSVFILNLMLGTSVAQHCGEIRNQTFSSSSLLTSMTLCRSQKLYFRTSLGLFRVTSVDYNTRTLTISHSSSSSSSSSLHFVSPMAVTAGLPSPESNSLLLFNCSSRRRNRDRNRNRNPMSPLIQNFRELCSSNECLVIDDRQKVDRGLQPKDLNCSEFIWVHRSSSDISNYGGYKFKLGTRISFDIPAHVPDLCKECEKPNGNCGAGLRCLCHAKDCKDKVLSKGGSINCIGNVLFSLLSFIGVIAFFIEFF